MQNKDDNEEKNINMKASLESFIETEKPEISQEEEIMNYHENVPTNKKNKKASSDDEDDENEDLDDEHLKRIKKELLASLEKVNKLAKLLFSDKEKKLKDLKVDKDSKTKSYTKEIEQNIGVDSKTLNAMNARDLNNEYYNKVIKDKMKYEN